MVKALQDVRILDLSHSEAGPICTLMLAFLGADVIKVENPKGGEMGRFTEFDKEGRDSYFFLTANSNKRAVTLDLTSDKGKEIFKELVKKVDIVVESFSLGTMEKLGLGYDVLKEINPKIIYGTVKGYGTYGPYKDYPCFDTVAQATGGVMCITGEADGPPLKSGSTVADSGSGIHLALALLAALHQRTVTGEGQHVEVAMQDVAMNFIRTAFWTSYYIASDPVRQRNGNKVEGVTPWNAYKCKGEGFNDYAIIAAAFKEHHVANLLKVMGREDLINDPMFDRKVRYQHAEEIDALIEDWTKTRTKREVMEELSKADVPAGACFTMGELLTDPQVAAREMFVEIDHPTRGKEYKVMGCPLKLSKSPVEVRPAPLLGQHKEEVYGELLGYSKQELAQLEAEGVI